MDSRGRDDQWAHNYDMCAEASWTLIRITYVYDYGYDLYVDVDVDVTGENLGHYDNDYNPWTVKVFVTLLGNLCVINTHLRFKS